MQVPRLLNHLVTLREKHPEIHRRHNTCEIQFINHNADQNEDLRCLQSMDGNNPFLKIQV